MRSELRTDACVRACCSGIACHTTGTSSRHGSEPAVVFSSWGVLLGWPPRPRAGGIIRTSTKAAGCGPGAPATPRQAKRCRNGWREAAPARSAPRQRFPPIEGKWDLEPWWSSRRASHVPSSTRNNPERARPKYQAADTCFKRARRWGRRCVRHCCVCCSPCGVGRSFKSMSRSVPHGCVNLVWSFLAVTMITFSPARSPLLSQGGRGHITDSLPVQRRC